METLQSTLKQREGENHQLQWELSRLQSDRNFLMAEVSKLTLELETVCVYKTKSYFPYHIINSKNNVFLYMQLQIKEKLSKNENIEALHNNLQQRYDKLYHEYNEKSDRINELQLDLSEAKEAYKIQINDILRQLKEKS